MNRAPATVLILEKDDATLELYRRKLGTEFSVLASSDERQALDFLRAMPIGALVLEPIALQRDLWDFVSIVRTIPACRHLPIVVCSTVDERRRRAELGVAAYLVKPVMPHELHLSVRQAMADVGA